MRDIVRRIVNATDMESAKPTVVSTDPVEENVINEEIIDLTASAAYIARFSEGGGHIKTFGMRTVKSQTMNGQTGPLHTV